ncbi:MAG: hypothetical protein RL748_550 [Pseudomonadota bacterium]|jgi:hypothetical protein
MSLESRTADVATRTANINTRLSNALCRLQAQNLSQHDVVLLENLLSVVETQVQALEHGCTLLENRATAKELGD